MKNLKNIRHVFLDMDETIYRGGTLFPCTMPFLNYLKKTGRSWIFLSNNSSFSTEDYLEKFARLGIPAEKHHFYISTDYCIAWLKKNCPEVRSLYLLGMDSIRPAFENAGFLIKDEGLPDAAVIAFDRSLTYEKLCHAAWLLKSGVPCYATHPDVFCPTDQATWLPDCGAIIACLETATGVKMRKVLGKPDPGMLCAAAERVGVPVEQCLMIGDRPMTDIAVGRNAGAATCLIAGDRDVDRTCADFCVRDLGELHALWAKLEGHPL